MSRCLQAWLCGALLLAAAGLASAQAPDDDPPSSPQAAQEAPAGEPATHAPEPATVRFFNREIATLRAGFLGQPPQRRAGNAEATLARVVGQPGTAEIGVREVPQGLVFTVAGTPAFVYTPADLDPMDEQTLAQARQEILTRLGAAVDAAEREQAPHHLLRGLLFSLLATAVLFVVLWGFHWLMRRVHGWVDGRLQARQARIRTEAMRHLIGGLGHGLRWLIRIGQWLLVLVMLEEWLRFVLGQFAYTRPWAEAMTGWILAQLRSWGGSLASALPGLLTVVVIFLLARLLTRTVGLMLKGVERGRYSLMGIDAHLAEPTRKLMVAVIWLFALVMAYPYLPGAQTDAFKGVSVLVGLMISLGASSIVGQAAGGFTLLYSRTMQRGDFVRIGDTEGVVQQIGLFTTRLRTFTGVEVSFPNTVVLGGKLDNYSRHPDGPGMWLETGVTIGYDTPWRQVQRLLTGAARATEGVQETPEPFVLQTALSDFYVEYRLRARILDPLQRNAILTALHGNIQDAFNEAGVQIMSPNYRADTEAPKIVPRELWEGPPAPEQQAR